MHLDWCRKMMIDHCDNLNGTKSIPFYPEAAVNATNINKNNTSFNLKRNHSTYGCGFCQKYQGYTQTRRCGLVACSMQCAATVDTMAMARDPLACSQLNNRKHPLLYTVSSWRD